MRKKENALNGNRQSWMKIHTVLSSFFLPVGLMFTITGIFLTLDTKTTTKVRHFSVQVPESTPSLGQAIDIVQANLKLHGFDNPTGSPSLKSDPKGWQLSWNGTGLSVQLKAKTDKPADFVIQENDLLKRAEQLHKNKGGVPFKVLSLLWATALLGLFASGTFLAFQVKTLRWLATGMLLFGLLSFFALAYVS